MPPRRVHHGDFRAGQEAPMGFCAATAAGDAELLAGAERDQPPLRDQRLREKKAAGSGLELIATDAALLAGAERDQLQLRDEPVI